MTSDRKIEIFESGWFKLLLSKGITLDENYEELHLEHNQEGFVKGIKNEFKYYINQLKDDNIIIKQNIHEIKNEIIKNLKMKLNTIVIQINLMNIIKN